MGADVDFASLDVVQQPIRARMCGFGDKVEGDTSPSERLQLRHTGN